jgi:type IX secretion system PorP/SprF family membrane protein
MKKIVFYGLVCFIHNPLFGQQDEQITFYQYNTLSYNPAFAGTQGKLCATAIGRFQWIQFSGAPTTQQISIHSSFAQNQLGIGGAIKHDQIGKRSRTEIDLNLANTIKLNSNKDQLRLGVSLGLNQYTIDFTDALVNDPGDPFCMKQTLSQFTAGFGLYYIGKKHFLGISVPHLLPNHETSKQQLLAFSTPHYYLTGGYDFTINPQLKLKATSLLKYVPHVPLTLDLNATLVFNDQLFGGFGYRLYEGIGLNGLIKLKQQFLIGYSYEFPINGLLNYQSGSHEIMLQFIVSEKTPIETIPMF